jgi:multimeric flavodoxin WrbA
MVERTATKGGTGSGRSGRAVNALLACGIASSLLYVVGDVIASASWAGYSYANQAVSELVGIGAPTRTFMLVLFSVYNLLVIAFAAGVWASAEKRALRVSAAMLVVYAVVGELTQLFSPMSPRGSVASANDVGHIILTAVEVLSIVLFIAFGSVARGKAFRLFSIGAILVIIAAGVTTGALSTHMTALASSTPWAGAIERVNIYGTLLWILALGVVLLRANRERAEAAAGGTGGAPAMKTVTVLVGSPHKGGATYTAARTLVDDLEAFGDVRGEIVMLGDYDIGVCRGCKVCFDRGEEHCPLKDDRDVLIGKIAAADAVVFASPNYSWNVSGVMKVFLDRIAFLFHRPRFHGKIATSIVVQGVFRGREIRKYLDFVAGGLGFKVVGGTVIHTLEPMTEDARRKMDVALAAQSRRLHERLLRPALPAPSLFELMVFRMGRTGIEAGTPEGSRDHDYYRDKGWFESDYYYPTRLGPFKRAAGAFFDWLGATLPVFKVADGTKTTALPPSSRPAPQ